MAQPRSYLESLNSPPHHISPPSKHLRPSFSSFGSRKGSVPELSSLKMPIPANVINIVPKSFRESSLKIFKAKEKEDRELGVKGDEPVIRKGDVYADSIRKKDSQLVVEYLVDKGKKEYAKKKNQKKLGSMYVNDLWGKQYEVTIKRQIRIDSELKEGETKKRRPLQIKLKEAVGYYEQKNINSARSGSKPEIFGSRYREDTRMGSEVEYRSVERPFLTEMRTESSVDSEEKEEKSERVPFFPNIKAIPKSQASGLERVDTTACTSEILSVARSSKFDYQGKRGELILTEPDLGSDFGMRREKEGSLTARGVRIRRPGKQKSAFADTKGAMDHLMNLFETDMGSKREFSEAFQGVREVWLKGVIEKQKRKEKIRREQLVDECAEMLKRGKKVESKGF